MRSQRETIPEADLEALFLSGGGRFTRRLEQLHLAHGGRLLTQRVAALLAALTWLPIVLLAVVEGVALGDLVEVPLLKDFLPYGQFLVAVPVLVLGEIVVGRRLGWAMGELRRSDILAPEDTPALEALLTRAAAQWGSRRATWVLLLLTFIATGLSFLGVQEWLTGDWQVVDDRLTMSGVWYLLISSSVLRFLTLRWLWLLLLWVWVLWQTARLKLQLQPDHPDSAGGLAFLGITQASFGLLVFALGVQVSCLIADAVAYQGASLQAYTGHVTAFVLIVVSLLLLPLLRFSPKLVHARGEALVFLSGSGYSGATHLEGRLRASRSGELPNDEISGLADFGALYENARKMKFVPLDVRHFLVVVLAALLPFLPLVLLKVPAREVLQALAKLVM